MKNSLKFSPRRILITLASALLCVVASGSITPACAQEARLPVDDEGRLIQFERDIAPIFVTGCLECHSGDKAKAGFEIDNREAVFEYIEAGDPGASILYNDYLITTDTDMLMPPASHGGPLTPPQLTMVRVWIEEGANWPEDATVSAPSAETRPQEATSEPVAAPTSTLGRYWAFQGYFHPATVHFPVALLTIGALFVVLGVFVPKIGTQVPLACLLLGSASAVVASAMGWSFAAEKGYPSFTAGWEVEVNAHRWSGLIVSAVAVVLSFVAIAGVRKASKPLNAIWKVGLLALAAMVGLVGHQGGEMTYPGLYEKAFARLNGPEAEGSPEAAETDTRSETVAEDATATSDEPTGEEPTAEEPTAEEPTAEEPTAEEPAVSEPAAEEPTGEPSGDETPAEEPEQPVTPPSDTPTGGE